MLRQYLGESHGCWLFHTVKRPDAPELFDALCAQGVLVRLTDEQDALRFGLPKESEHNWQRLAHALQAIQQQSKTTEANHV